MKSKIALPQNSFGCLLTFHRAAEPKVWEGLPNRNFYLSLSFLDTLLGKLKQANWEVVTIDALLSKLRRGVKYARYVNFSVDDCYRDTWDKVVPLFRRHRVPVTLFVTTGIPDGTHSLGLAGLESILAHREKVRLDGEAVDISSPAEKRRWFRKISQAWEDRDFDSEYGDFCRANDADAAELRKDHAITWEMLDTVRDDPFVEIGAHTISHPRISALGSDAALAELLGSKDRLQARLGVPCRHFAFPYGRSGDCGARDFDLARRAGFLSAATTRKGLVRHDQDNFSLPRNTLNGAYQSMAYINLLLSGLGGLAAKVLRRA